MRREVYREYVRLAEGDGDEVVFETLPVHEADRLDVIVAWGDEPLDPDESMMSRADYDAWRDELQDERLTAGIDRTPGPGADPVPDETPPTDCPWVTFP